MGLSVQVQYNRASRCMAQIVGVQALPPLIELLGAVSAREAPRPADPVKGGSGRLAPACCGRSGSPTPRAASWRRRARLGPRRSAAALRHGRQVALLHPSLRQPAADL